MARKKFAIFSAFVVGFVLLSLFALYQRPGNGQAQQLQADTQSVLPIPEAEEYVPRIDAPRGIRVTAELSTAKVRASEERPLELDVRLERELAAMFEVADATVWDFRKGRDALIGKQQPFHMQRPPKDADARFLFLELPDGEYGIDFYLRPRDVKYEPTRGLAYLKNEELRQRNFRVTAVGND